MIINIIEVVTLFLVWLIGGFALWWGYYLLDLGVYWADLPIISWWIFFVISTVICIALLVAAFRPRKKRSSPQLAKHLKENSPGRRY